MVDLDQLWLPIIVSSVVVFVVSSLVHMVLPWHKGDFPKLPEEDKIMEALRPFKLTPGEFMAPRASGRKEMKSAEFADKLRKGPIFIITVFPNGRPGMGKSLGLWFVYTIIIGIFSAYVAGRTAVQPLDSMQVFRLASTTAFLGYAMALWEMSIWFGRPWRTSIKATADGLIYGIATGLVFSCMWPK